MLPIQHWTRKPADLPDQHRQELPSASRFAGLTKSTRRWSFDVPDYFPQATRCVTYIEDAASSEATGNPARSAGGSDPTSTPSPVPSCSMRCSVGGCACGLYSETDDIEQSCFDPTAATGEPISSRLAGREKGIVAAGRRMLVQHAPDPTGKNVLFQPPTALLN